MRTETPEARSEPSPYSQEGVRNYLFIGLAAALVLFVALFSSGSEIGALMAAGVAAAGLLLRWVAAPAMVVVLTAYFRLDPYGLLLAGQWSAPPPGSVWSEVFRVQDLVVCLALLVYLVAQFRLLSLLSRSIPPGPRTLGPRRRPVRRPADHVEDAEYGRLFGVALACVIGGQIAGALLTEAETPYRLSAVWERLMWLLGVLGLGGMLAGAAFAYLRMRQATPDQARRFLEDIAWQETLREQSRLQRWRAWRRGRAARTNSSGKSR